MLAGLSAGCGIKASQIPSGRPVSAGTRPPGRLNKHLRLQLGAKDGPSFSGCVPNQQSDELDKQNPFYYSVRAASRLLSTGGGRWLVESDEWWSLHGLGACSPQRGGEAKSPSTHSKEEAV